LLPPVRVRMQKHADPALLADVDTILIDCGLRPEECFRLGPANLVDGGIDIRYGKTKNARRRIPMTPRVKAILEMRLEKSRASRWVFPAPTKSGHIEKSSLRKQHATALKTATAAPARADRHQDHGVENFDLYALPTYLPHAVGPAHGPVDADADGRHSDMATTMRYIIHPRTNPRAKAMQRARERGGKAGRGSP